MGKNVLSKHCALPAQPMFACVTTLFLVVFLSHNSFGQAQLVRDIAYMEDIWDEYSHLINGDGTFYFFASNQLWRSDGSKEGTEKLMDFRYATSPLWANSTLYFIADDGISGRELWKSDGTKEGTSMVKDILPGSNSSSPDHLSQLNGTLFFSANDGVHGKEVWKSDGTPSGTKLVRDIMRVTGSSNPYGFTAFGSHIFFSANYNGMGYELWKTDGTEEGTILVKDLNTGNSAPNSFTPVNNKLFFVARSWQHGKELWVTDGTSQGTRMVKEIRPGYKSPLIENMTAVNSTLFFTATDGVHGVELWKSDGTAEGTQLVKDMTPGSAGSHGEGPFTNQMGNLTNVNGTLFYTAYQKDEYYIWKSDGTTEGTIPLHHAAGPGGAQPTPLFTYMNGYIYYFNQTGDTSSDDFYLSRMNEDGSNPTVIQWLFVYDYYNPYQPRMVRVGNHLYFTGQIEGGVAIIKSDGTRNGTKEFIDANDGTVSSDPDNLIVFNGRVYFDVRDLSNEFYYYDFRGGLWRTDGTSDGTTDVLQGFDVTMSAVTDEALFVAGMQGSRSSLWKVDRQNNVTQMVIFDYQKTIADVETVGSTLFFSTTAGELWRSDGTAEGTYLLLDKQRILSMTATSRGLMAQAISDSGDEELWRSGGTATTTSKVKTMRTGWATPSNQYPTAVINGILFFVANDGVHGNEIWRSNGTTTGTYMALDVNGNDRIENGNVENDILDMTVFDSKLSFSALKIIDNTDHWILGSYEDGEMAYGFHETEHPIVQLIPDEGHLFLIARNNGYELWSYYYNRPMEALASLGALNYVQGFDYEIANGVLYYSTRGGSALWRSDGTACGTFALDIETRGAHEMALLGDKLIFASWEQAYGRELYSYDLGLDPGNPCENVESRSSENSVARTSIEDLYVYPNPVTSGHPSLTLSGYERVSDAIDTEIRIASMTGEVVFIDRIRCGGNCQSYLLQVNKKLIPGIYVVSLSSGGRHSTRLLVVKD